MVKAQTSEKIAFVLQALQKKCWAKDKILADDIGLSVPEFNLLTFFYNEENLPIKFLTSAMNVTPGRITHLVTSLEDNKYIKRALDKNDRRIVQVSLTAKGRKLVNKIQGVVTDYFDEMLSGLNNAMQNDLYDNLKVLSKIMEDSLNGYAK